MKNFLRGFGFAINGIVDGLNNERNLRLHWLMGTMVIFLVAMHNFSRHEEMFFVVLVSLVLTLELMNCAIEKTCDAVTREFHHEIRRAKDFAAASVLMMSFGSAIIFLMIITENADEIYQNIVAFPVRYVVWVLASVINVFIVFTSRGSLLMALLALTVILDVLLILSTAQNYWALILAGIAHLFLIISTSKSILESKKHGS